MDMQALIAKLRANKPPYRCIERSAVERLRNPDALSTNAVVFRNGGSCGTELAVPFVELTPELQAFLVAVFES